MLSSCVRLSVRVCPSVTSRYCIETTGLMELVVDTEASFHMFHTVLSGTPWISKNKGTFSETFPKFWTLKVSQWQVDRAVNKIRRRSSLLTTPMPVDASRLFATRRSAVTL